MSLYAVATLFNGEGIPSPSMWRERVKESGRTFKWTGGVVGKIVQEKTYLGMRIEDRSLSTEQKRNGRRFRTRVRPADLTAVADERTEALVDLELWERANRVTRSKQETHSSDWRIA